MADCDNNIVVTFYPDCSVQIKDGQTRRRYYFDSIEVIDYDALSVTLAGNSSRVSVNYEDLQIPNVNTFDAFVKWIQDQLNSKNPFDKICSIENSLVSVLACLEDLKLINTDIELNTDDVATETTLASIETLMNSIITQLGLLATEATQLDVEVAIGGLQTTLDNILTALGSLATEVTLGNIETILTNTLTAINGLATEATLSSVDVTLTNIETIAGTLATEATAITISATLTSMLTAIGGLATEATLVDVEATLVDVEVLLTTITSQLATAVTSLGNIDANTANLEARLDSIIAILEGDVTADIVDAVVDGSTDVNVKAVSILVLGLDASIDGVPVPDNYSASWGNEHGGEVTNAIPYVVPTGFGSSGFKKIIITYNR